MAHFYLIMLTTQQQEKALATLLQKKDNALCADCNGKSPCWASLDFGVFVCMNCSGAHRFLGPTITRVRSTKLDKWNRDWLENMRVGNTLLNEYWEHGLTDIKRTAKPTINSSLNDIVKFVQDKYVKRKYVDPEQPLDPLKRSKLPLETKSQPVQIKQDPPNIPKEIVKPLPNNTTKEPGFNFINNQPTIPQKPQRKLSDNLISFEKEQVNATEKTPEVAPQPQKYNHVQFHTVSGTKPKEQEQFISFDNLVKGNEPAKQAPHHVHNNYLLNPNTHHFQNNAAGHYSTGHYGNHAQPYYHPQYVTMNMNMNVNMNMYPKVMNINMSPPVNNYLPHQTPPQNNNHFTNQFLGQPQQPQQPQRQAKITLDSNIILGASKAENEAPKSWIDEWK